MFGKISKKLFLALFIISLSTLIFKKSDAKFDINRTIKKAELALRKDFVKAKESVEKITTDIVKKESLFDKTKSFFSLESLIIAKLPLIYIILLALIIGIAASFTPCIYPMIPITIGILQSQASKSVGRNFMLSVSYVSGMASVYAVLGYFAATTTMILGQWLANPWFIGILVLLFMYLAFSMFGFYEIYMPRFLTRGSSVKIKGSVLYSFVFGAISGTAASPCLTPALALLLGYVAKRGNPLIGMVTLFTFAFGMGLLLIVVGTFSNTITNLPRAGAWMNEIKKVFGFMLVGVSIYFLQPIINPMLARFLYLNLLIITVFYYVRTIFRGITKKR
jgi:thiol:disulfide interchange protein DsbD